MTNYIMNPTTKGLAHDLSFVIHTLNPKGVDAVEAIVKNGVLVIMIMETVENAAAFLASPGLPKKAIKARLYSCAPGAIAGVPLDDPTIPFKTTIPAVPGYQSLIPGNAEVPLSYERVIPLDSNGDLWYLALTGTYDLPLPS